MPLDLAKTRTARKPIATVDPDVFVKMPPQEEIDKTLALRDELNAEHAAIDAEKESIDAESAALEAEREALAEKHPQAFVDAETAERGNVLAERTKALSKRTEEWGERVFDQVCNIFRNQLCDENGDPPVQQTVEDIKALGGQALHNYRVLVEDTLDSLGKGERRPGFRG